MTHSFKIIEFFSLISVILFPDNTFYLLIWKKYEGDFIVKFKDTSREMNNSLAYIETLSVKEASKMLKRLSFVTPLYTKFYKLVKDIDQEELVLFKKHTLEFLSTFDLIIKTLENVIEKNEVWADAEFYFYGKLIQTQNKESILIETHEHGFLTIKTNQSRFKLEEEHLEGELQFHVSGKQSIGTAIINEKSLNLIGLQVFSSKYDENYLNNLNKSVKNKSTWEGIDADEWLHQIRGAYEA